MSRLLKMTLASVVALAAPLAVAQQSAKAPVAVVETPEQSFARIDKNGDRQISLDEFKAEWQARRQQAALRRLQRQFRAMDSNHSGGLDTVEFSQLLLIKNAGTKAPTFVSVDSNHDQKLDFAEYVALVARYGKTVQVSPARKP